MSEDLERKLDGETVIRFIDGDNTLTLKYEGILDLPAHEIVRLRNAPEGSSVRPGEYVIRAGEKDKGTGTELQLVEKGADKMIRNYECHRLA